MKYRTKYTNLIRNNSSGRVKIIVIALILLVSAYLYWDYSSDLPFRFKGVNRNKHVDIDNDTSCSVPNLIWTPNARQMYDYRLTTDITTIVANTNFKYHIKATVKGTLNFRVFDMPSEWIDPKYENLIIVGFQLYPVEVTIVDEEKPNGLRDEGLENTYKTLFAVAFLPDGTPEKFYYQAHSDSMDQIAISEIVHAVQVVVPLEKERQSTNKWYSMETHTTGDFRVEYLVKQNQCDKIYKQNVRCIKMKDLARIGKGYTQNILFGHIVKSDFKSTILPDFSWIKDFSGSEIFEIRTENGIVSSKYNTSVSLKNRDFIPDPSLLIWSDNLSIKELIEQNSSESLHNKENQAYNAQQTKKRSDRISVIQILEDIQNASNKLSQNQTLKEYLETYPSEASLIPNLLKTMNLKGMTAGNIIMVLHQVGHPEAQIAIKDIFTDSNQSPDTRLRAVIASGEVTHPIQELLESLITLADLERVDKDEKEIAGSSLMSLGLLSQAFVKNKQTSHAKRIYNKLISSLEKTEDESDRILCINALANTFAPEVAATLIKLLPNEQKPQNDNNKLTQVSSREASLQEQIAVIKALARVADQTSIKSLINMIDYESNANIRKEAILALMERNETDINTALQNRLKTETEADIISMLQNHLNNR